MLLEATCYLFQSVISLFLYWFVHAQCLNFNEDVTSNQYSDAPENLAFALSD
ncbi:hypothetical protein LSTR_LSTR011794 [Laodelphax striatellus]|uniref:Uncharacterized protein n=1 Tax=Laodelphax striatellus TaxID=195883 RepID=A0A482XMV5_LAOST|nr:hypothetical protein LSTR_LSTR011794 [Laodelphax striatellus]